MPAWRSVSVIAYLHAASSSAALAILLGDTIGLGSFATFEAYSDHGLADSRVGFTEIWAQSLRVQ